MSSPIFINIAFYKFFAIPSPHEHKLSLREEAIRLGLKGTVLLSLEGVNGMLSGTEESISAFKKILVSRLGSGEIEFKESKSSHQPYTRMLVKVKKEIISMGVPEVRPEVQTGKRLSAQEFKKWMDEKRGDFTVLDTRNIYEIEMGAFEGAQDLKLDSFRAFPERLEKWASDHPELKNQPVVMYCTGGIRCEKATALAMLKGFNDVYQLDGGILKYFESVGGQHYRGECYVFDKREGVLSDLSEK